jgi:predicted transcriptional regulator
MSTATKPRTANQILVSLRAKNAADGRTASDLNTTSSTLMSMEKDGLIARNGKTKVKGKEVILWVIDPTAAATTKRPTRVEIIESLNETPGQTANELNALLPTLRAMEEAGLIEETGKRKTGSRGRPAAEFSALVAELPTDDEPVEVTTEADDNSEAEADDPSDTVGVD